VNLVGNCLATAVMARWEGELSTDGPALSPAPGRPAVAAAPSDA
jgi:Na+/H+-dicarboxylate symporter